MRKDLISSLVAVVAFTVLCGLAYPLVVTGISQVAFPGRADGWLVERDGKVVGSRLIGQDFSDRPRRCSSPARRSPATTRPRTFFNNRGPNSKDLATHRQVQPALLALDAAVQPGPHARRDPARRGRRPRPRASTRTSRSPTRASRPAASRRASGIPQGARPRAGRGQHRRPRARRLRRARRQRARAQPRDPGGPAMSDRPQQRSLFSAEMLRPAVARRAPQARPAPHGPQPGHVRRRGRRRAHDRHLDRPGARRQRAATEPAWFTVTVAIWLWLTVRVRQPRRGDRRGPRQGAGGDAARDAHDETVATTAPTATQRAGGRAAPRRRRRRRGGRGHPRRRHRHRGHRLGRRVGDHRRVGARHPRGRRRPLGGHRRHARAVGPDRRRDHAGAGPVLPRPHDRARRGRRRGARPRTRSRSASCSPA